MVISQNNDVLTTGKAQNKQQFLTSSTVLTSHINDPTTFTPETYLTRRRGVAMRPGLGNLI